MEMQFLVTITATGEVRDKDGNLVSSTPMTGSIEVPEEHLRASGMTEAQINEIKEQ